MCELSGQSQRKKNDRKNDNDISECDLSVNCYMKHIHLIFRWAIEIEFVLKTQKKSKKSGRKFPRL